MAELTLNPSVAQKMARHEGRCNTLRQALKGTSGKRKSDLTAELTRREAAMKVLVRENA